MVLFETGLYSVDDGPEEATGFYHAVMPAVGSLKEVECTNAASEAVLERAQRFLELIKHLAASTYGVSARAFDDYADHAQAHLPRATHPAYPKHQHFDWSVTAEASWVLRSIAPVNPRYDFDDKLVPQLTIGARLQESVADPVNTAKELWIPTHTSSHAVPASLPVQNSLEGM